MIRSRVLATGAAAVAVWLVAAVPAHAGTPTITIRTPGTQGQSFTSEGYRFDATAGMASSDGRLEGSVGLQFISPAGRPVPEFPNGFPTNNARTVNVTTDVSFPWNGTYEVRVTATGRNNFLDGDRTPRTESRSFAIDAKPDQPTGVKAAADSKTRVVTVSWTANTEPDRVGYVVEKQGSGGRWNDFVVTDKTSVTDESTANAGGTYSYRVRALRHSATPNQLNPSEPSSTQSATVASPPTTTTAPTGEGGSGEEGREGANGGDNGQAGTEGSTGGASGDGATTSGGGGAGSSSGGRSGAPNLATTGKVDLSDFQSLLAQAERQGQAGGGLASGEDEGTYEETLPFGARGRIDADGDGEADDPASIVGDGGESGPDLQALGFLAGGLLATVLAMHVLWVRAEVNRAEKLEVVAPEGPEPVSAAARFGLGEGRPRRSRSQPPAEQPDPAPAP